MKKETYEAPAMETLGSFEKLTQGGQTGEQLDAEFPVLTPRGDLTFS